MTHKLLPRFTTPQAMSRFKEIKSRLAEGVRPSGLVELTLAGAVPNATGGPAASVQDLASWRSQVLQRLDSVFHPQLKAERDQHSITLGRAIEEVIHPSPSDAAHDGVWSYLSLMVFPDVVHARWPGTDGELPPDRWVGKQRDRDRNYLKLAWRRWVTLGPVLEEAAMKIGEDEFGALLERSSLARNKTLIQAAAREVIGFSNSGRMQFARDLMKLITYRTGPLNLDILSAQELTRLVRQCSLQVTGPLPEQLPAAEAPVPATPSLPRRAFDADPASGGGGAVTRTAESSVGGVA